MFAEVRFEVLGPVRGWRGEAELELGSPQQQAVLTMLLLARGRQVSADVLVDGLWGERAPRSALGTVRTHVSRLRRACAVATGQPDDLIASLGDGYLLRPGSAVLDLDLFEGWVREARAARARREAAHCARLLRDALGLWAASRWPEFPARTPVPAAPR